MKVKLDGASLIARDILCRAVRALRFCFSFFETFFALFVFKLIILERHPGTKLWSKNNTQNFVFKFQIRFDSNLTLKRLVFNTLIPQWRTWYFSTLQPEILWANALCTCRSHYKRPTEKLVSFDNWSTWITLNKKLLLDTENTKSIIPFKSSYSAYPWQRLDVLCNLNVLLLLAVQSCKQFLVAKFG